MLSLPTSANANGTSFTITDFLEAGRERLGLSLLVGEKGLDRTIDEPVLNRPGLALTGFVDHFANKRIQIFGNSEVAYLQSLDKITLEKRLRAIAKSFRLAVVTNGVIPGDTVRQVAEECGVTVLISELTTDAFMHQATLILENLRAPRTSIYGTMVEVCGLGVLFEGDPGLGKSETALGLIKRGHALISDDLTCVRKDVMGEILYGSASASTAGFMEIRGIGILHVRNVFGVNAVRGEKRLQLVITFKRLKDVAGDLDRLGQTRRYKNILGVNVPQIIIPVSEGRDLVNLVETAAQQQKLLETGYDPVSELSERLKVRADGAAAAVRKISRTKGKGKK